MGQCVIMTGGYAGDSSDDCTATKSQVLEGYKAITKDSDDDAELGTMPNKGTWTNRIGVNGKAIIPAGYHNGSGYVDQAITNRGAWGTSIGVNGNITIPEGYHNGQGHVTQSIATLGGQTITPSASQQTVSCSGKYMTGNVVVNSCYSYKCITYRMLSAPSTMQFASTETTGPVGGWMLNGAYIESTVNDFSKIKMIIIYSTVSSYPNNKNKYLASIYDIETIDTWGRCSVDLNIGESVAVWGNCYINQNGSFRIPVITKDVKSGNQIPNFYFNEPYNVKIVGY